MFQRNFPLILLFLVFVGLLILIGQIPPYKSTFKPIEEFASESEELYFRGTVKIPSLEDIYVLENSAHRDISKLETYMKGRSAGLHFLFQEHFKKNKHKEVTLGIHLELDSLGNFSCKGILFSNAQDELFEQNLIKHIEYFWKYRKAPSGKTEFWIPFQWKAKS